LKVLVLHPEDGFSALPESRPAWDLIVDLGRAPLSTYQDWSRQAGCRVISLYDYADDIEDRRRVKALLQLGMNQVVDRFGVDWWDVSSLLIVDDLLRSLLVGRLAKELGAGCELQISRPGPLAEALRRRSGGSLSDLQKGWQPMARRIRHYREALANLDAAKLAQVLQDKFDSEHRVRRRLAWRRRKSTDPVTLLPSVYINVSRMAVAYAAMLPEERFLLVCSRSIAKLKRLPPNVEITSLDPYVVSADPVETASLLRQWSALEARLVSAAEEFADAETNGALARIPLLVRSGLAVRNAWNQVLSRENVTGCLSADDTAPDTRIPLILAKNRGLAALACHHGALDQRMAVKKNHADFYLVKSEMERDYLLRVCMVPPEQLIMGGPASVANTVEPVSHAFPASWLVFFTEPYQTGGWRSDEVYRDLLPRLCALAQTCGLRLVFKLHPFESIRSIRRLLRRYLPPQVEREILVTAGPISSQLWQNMRFALTVQSTVAMSCCERGMPVFLCVWLGDRYSGYIRQYVRFGIGHALDSPEQIADIPRLLETWGAEANPQGARRQTMSSALLHNLLHRRNSLPAEARA
jgi:hypothetical protein